MSEYQYYEFLALDRPLTEKQRAELRSISTRAEITATRFVNEYQWGDLKGDPRKMMEQRAQHQRKPSLLDRFDQAGLPS
jgi:hypothetical protein